MIEDLKELVERLKSDLQIMASEACVPMGLWDRFSNNVLIGAEAITRLLGEVEGLRKDARDRCSATVEAATPEELSAGKYTALPAGWRPLVEPPKPGQRIVALYDDGSGAGLFFVHDGGLIDSDGEDVGEELPDSVYWWAPIPGRLWCEMRDDDPMAFDVPLLEVADPGSRDLIKEVGNNSSAQTEGDRSREHALSLRVGELEEGLRAARDFIEAEYTNHRYAAFGHNPIEVSARPIYQTLSRLLSEGVSSATVDPVKVEAATPSREEIARVVDPDGWRILDAAKPGPMYPPRIAVSLAKADAILALSAPPLKGIQGVSADANARDHMSNATGSDHGDQLGTTRAPGGQA